jgi:3-hydroxyisobutyrate dehydrogenase-like beta-hydroxyacid dehydrogenase
MLHNAYTKERAMTATGTTAATNRRREKTVQANHRIGWLGTGRMGAAMAARLISDGAAVTVWNRTAAKAQPLAELGADQTEKISDLGRCDIVFTSITASPDLLAVTLGPDGLFDARPAPSIVVDTSTVSAEAAAEVRTEATKRGIGFLSAPISGNANVVANGQASIVASGPKSVFDTALPYLRAIAPSVTYAGAGGEAQLVKLAHNLLVGIIAESLAEATVLAEKGGVAPSAFLDFINGSVLGSVFIAYKGQAIRNHDYEPTFTTELLRKDFDLGLAAARSLDVPMPVAATTYQAIQTAIGHGYGKSDFATLYEVAARAAALPKGDDQT